jgi:KDO2-lipid IV(A) lauroyltransferase
MVELCLGAWAAVVARFPFRWLRWLGLPLAWAVGSMLRVRRAHVESALKRAGCDAPARTARAMYRALGTSVMELLWLSRHPTAGLAEICALDPASRAMLDDALAEGKGAVLAASHTGNWELAACSMAEVLDLHVVVKPIAMQGFDRFMTRARRAHGLGLAPPEGALARAREVLSRRGCVAMLIDQVPEEGSRGVAVDFLGATALADRAPAALAASTGAPLVVVAFRRTRGGAHTIEVLDVLYPPPRGRRVWTHDATRRATLALERFVRRHPSEWLWMHRRWRAPRAAPSCPRPSLDLEERHA